MWAYSVRHFDVHAVQLLRDSSNRIWLDGYACWHKFGNETSSALPPSKRKKLNSEHYFTLEFETDWNELTNYFCEFLAIFSANISVECIAHCMDEIEGWNSAANIDNKITTFSIEKIRIICVVWWERCAPETDSVERKESKPVDFGTVSYGSSSVCSLHASQSREFHVLMFYYSPLLLQQRRINYAKRFIANRDLNCKPIFLP